MVNANAARRFPIVNNHADVACFNCTHTLAASAPQESGFAPRHGEYKKECPQCGMKTWYDLRAAK